MATTDNPLKRLASIHRLDLWSVVFYVGQGASVRDTGQHQVYGPTDTPTLTWQYQVIRLWQIPAEELLALGRPALLALVGQTRLTQPEIILPQVVALLRQVPEREQRGSLLTVLLALLRDEEMVHDDGISRQNDHWSHFVWLGESIPPDFTSSHGSTQTCSSSQALNSSDVTGLRT
jgi:hypothetical protein